MHLYYFIKPNNVTAPAEIIEIKFVDKLYCK